MNIETHTHEHWFALKVFYNKVFEIEDILKKDKIETYIPCEETLMERNGIKKKLRRPVINSLMFFRSTVCRALEVQRQFTNKVILYTRQKGLKRLPLAIPDREMNIFMLVTSSGEQGMEYFGEDNSKFHQENVYGSLTESSRERKGLSAGLGRIAVWWSPSKVYAPWLPPIFRRPF